MSAGDDTPPPEGRTVYVPPKGQPSPADTAAAAKAEQDWFGGGPAPPPPAPPPPPPPAAPSAGWDDEPPPAVVETAPPPPPPPPPPPKPTTATPDRMGPGVVLNSIYEIRRLIARGGMGEVYEGFNVNNPEERVAIKVMLPHLAADPAIDAMFRKEAGILTHLHHPALVQYRLMAREPAMGVLYIVTEFIDGDPMSGLLGQARPTAEQLMRLLRRLADGLAAAHARGAIHRDIAPDNVLLPGGDLDRAKIIDFGIAKDLDPTKKTIVGSGFAGKLAYVAPEQLGDYDREVGPWTDIYSLALVCLALVNGRSPYADATIIEAGKSRRKPPDLASIPPILQPLFRKMLAPDPRRRYRTMAEVIAALDALEPVRIVKPPHVFHHDTGKRPVFGQARPTAGASSETPAGSTAAPSWLARIPRTALIAGGLAGVLLALVLVIVLWPRPHAPPTEDLESPPAPPPREQVRQAVEAALPTLACSWLDIDAADSAPGGGVRVKLSGVAGDPLAVQGAVSRAARGVGATVGEVDTADVARVQPAACALLDAFRPFRDTGPGAVSLVSQQARYEIAPQTPGCEGDAAKARAVVNAHVGAGDFALVNMGGEGAMQPLLLSRKDAAAKTGGFLSMPSPSRLSYSPCTGEPGLVGFLLVTAPRAPDLGLAADAYAPPPRDWAAQFSDKARRQGWKTQMAWFTVADDLPN